MLKRSVGSLADGSSLGFRYTDPKCGSLTDFNARQRIEIIGTI